MENPTARHSRIGIFNAIFVVAALTDIAGFFLLNTSLIFKYVFGAYLAVVCLFDPAQCATKETTVCEATGSTKVMCSELRGIDKIRCLANSRKEPSCAE